ncbi:facilitated trehalose transporter Tret1-like isoform X1 [Haemaphysalis longicornis]
MLGALLGGPSSQYLGRRQTLLLSALCFMAGYSCIMTARSAEFTLIGRFVTGLATGIVSLCAPVYISEIVVATQRGSLGAVFQLAVTLGILYSYVMSRFMQWKWLAAACFFCSVLLVITSHFAVESPRWLLLRGRKLDAILCLQVLRGPDIRVDDECYAIEQVFPSVSTPRSHVLLALKGNFMQQFSGINMFIFYAGSLFQSVGISISAKDTSIIMAGLQVGATLVAVALMDVVGRRRLLSVSSIICVFALTTIGALYSMSSGGEQEATPSVWPSIDRLPVVFMGLYVMGYSIGLGPVVWVLNAELVPCRFRGGFLGAVIAFNWACALAVTLLFTFTHDTLRLSGLGWLFSSVTFGGALLVLYSLPETTCLSLEQILQGQFGQDEASAVSLTRISSLGRDN